MKKKDNNLCKIVVRGAELVELKRHAHEIPECPVLGPRIQRYQGEKPFTMTFEELGWMVAVLEAVLNDPKGYPCIDHDLYKIDYVSTSDLRCDTCEKLYNRLKQEEDRIWDLLK